jgi:hypothetical protein
MLYQGEGADYAAAIEAFAAAGGYDSGLTLVTFILAAVDGPAAVWRERRLRAERSHCYRERAAG